MRLFIVFLLSLLTIPSVFAKAESINLKAFATNYYNAMVASQAPNATTKELEAYLAFLTDDVGHSHLPYVTDDSRLPDGKEAMRKGMTFYLGAHTEYNSELLNIFVFNDSAVAIRYTSNAKGIHPQNNQALEYSNVMMEVLEIEDGKVAVIRKYHE
ncbi:nuclear transport factor 2 family protein [Pseudoalteromonas piratica]|uniref:SnoaL-like domain-containing protein n=1 Tax=Pseudoalteromonas piratica TaxID=1348114 RepID=A0A0A7EJS9_9GAMM|nr:nuclear transport factor 2 family protein [Pseudoalteromonas piratica]AIY66935.1 hypothetical protein OM33_17770 [Pseudoalteromonas piratica]